MLVVQMKSIMTCIQGNMCIEREKDNFQSCEVKRLKEYAQALNFQLGTFLSIIQAVIFNGHPPQTGPLSGIQSHDLNLRVVPFYQELDQQSVIHISLIKGANDKKSDMGKRM